LTAPLIPRDVLFGNAERERAQISPDGTMIAYLAPSDGMMSVWVCTLGAGDARMIARDPERPIPWLAWQGDGRHVLYLQDRGGNENYHLFQVDLAGETIRELTPGEGIRCVPISIDDRFPDEALVTMNERDPRLMDVCRIDFRRGTVALDTENPGDVISWLADGAHRVRAAVAQLPDGSSCIRVREHAAGEWGILDRYSSSDGLPSLVAFTPDGASLSVITAKGANASRLVTYDLTTAAVSVLLEDEAYDVSVVHVDPGSRRIVAAAILRDRLTWHAIDDAFSGTLGTLSALHDADFTIDDASADGTTLVVRYRFDNGPARYYTFDTQQGHAAPLFIDRPALLEQTLAPMRAIAFPARDGLTIHGYLTVPVGTEPARLPMVLLVHGGPWHRDRWGYDPYVQWLANRGYAVLQINFRGSTGYGKAFLNAGNRQWAGAMRTDLLDGREWAIAQGIADPERIAIFGGSYGGYAVLTALAFTPDAFACGVDLVGPSNLNTLLGSLPPYWEPMRKLFHERMGEDPAFLDSQSPLFKAGEIRSPLLIAQGANDPRVKQAESDQIVAAMRENQIPVTYLVFDNEGHGFADPQNNKRFTALAEAFLARTLGGRVQPASDGESVDAYLR